MNVGFFMLLLLFAVLLMSTALVGALLPILRRLRAGQHILAIGPLWHMKKEGTPTMGGIGFSLAALLGASGACVWLYWQNNTAFLKVILVFSFALACGLIGFFDDYLKLRHGKNEGLLAWQKYFLQLVASTILLFVSMYSGVITTTVILPFSLGTWSLGIFYYPLALLFLTGMVNALNLADGVDGLLSSLVAVLSLYFLIFGLWRGDLLYSVVGSILLGAVIGFLFYNKHPAKIFMGDTGSLFLGGAVAALGILAGEAPSVILAGGVFVIEAASVCLQVVYFKITHGKRLFLMAPLHHHFEKKGMSEWGVVGLFSACGLIFALLAFLGGVL